MRFDRRSPCESCPYRKDAPVGLWHPSEFAKLLGVDRSLLGAIYMCHEGRKRPEPQRGPCVGWLLDQRERELPSVMLRHRLLINDEAGDLGRMLEQSHAGGAPLFRSVEAMCRANGVRVPK